MKEYTVRRCFLRKVNTKASSTGFKKKWVSIWDDKGYTKKYTMKEAEEAIRETFEHPEDFGCEVIACRIYKGKEIVKETVREA